MLSWNCPPVAPLKATRLVVAHHAGRDLHHALAHHRVDLARHDRAARLAVGQHDLVEAAARAAAEPADVVGDVEQRDGDRPQLAVALDQAVALGVGLEVVHRFDERDAGFLREHLGDAAAELGMRVDARADRRAAGGQLEHGFDGAARPARPTAPAAGRSRRTPAPAAAAWHRPGACGRS